MPHTISSLESPNRRYRIGYGVANDAYRVPRAIPNASFYDTLGDGETQHTPELPVSLVSMTVDLIRSCHAALGAAIDERNTDLVDRISEALSCHFDCDYETAVKAVKAARGPKVAYMHRKEVVTGTKWANRRDAEPLPPLDAEADLSVQSRYRHARIVGQYPSILELLVGARIADTHDYCYSLKAIGEQNAMKVVGNDSLQEALYFYDDCIAVIAAYTRCQRFIAAAAMAEAARPKQPA